MAELAKYTTTLATGALVFSADLITKDVALSTTAKSFLIASWIALTLSIVAGILTISRFPIMTADGNSNVEDTLLVWPGRIHQVLILLGMMLLGTALVLALAAKGPRLKEELNPGSNQPQLIDPATNPEQRK
jgi:hypothetical protein